LKPAWKGDKAFKDLVDDEVEAKEERNSQTGYDDD
jgi:hypothetical protein